MKHDIKLEKAENLALGIIRLCRLLTKEKTEYVISQQLLRSGTSIGANISEACYSESRADFVHKLCISQKEANETLYWLRLLQKSGVITESNYSPLYAQTEEILKILSSAIRSLKSGLRKSPDA